MKDRRDRAPFIGNPPGLGHTGGVPVFPFSPGSPSAHRLSLKDDLRH